MISLQLRKQNACEKVKCKFSLFIQVQTDRKQHKTFCKSNLTLRKLIILFLDLLKAYTFLCVNQHI